MGKDRSTLPPTAQSWVEARTRYHLSHAQVQMAGELGMDPRRLGKIASHRQEPWKAPSPQFIEELYLMRFGQERPQVVMPAEEWRRPGSGRKAVRRAGTAKARGER